MSEKNEPKVIVRSGGVGAFTLLGIAFVVLKLTGYINWAWWIVLSPFWAPLALCVVVLVVMLLIVAIATALGE